MAFSNIALVLRRLKAVSKDTCAFIFLVILSAPLIAMHEHHAPAPVHTEQHHSTAPIDHAMHDLNVHVHDEQGGSHTSTSNVAEHHVPQAFDAWHQKPQEHEAIDPNQHTQHPSGGAVNPFGHHDVLGGSLPRPGGNPVPASNSEHGGHPQLGVPHLPTVAEFSAAKKTLKHEDQSLHDHYLKQAEQLPLHDPQRVALENKARTLRGEEQVLPGQLPKKSPATTHGGPEHQVQLHHQAPTINPVVIGHSQQHVDVAASERHRGSHVDESLVHVERQQGSESLVQVKHQEGHEHVIIPHAQDSLAANKSLSASATESVHADETGEARHLGGELAHADGSSEHEKKGLATRLVEKILGVNSAEKRDKLERKLAAAGEKWEKRSEGLDEKAAKLAEKEEAMLNKKRWWLGGKSIQEKDEHWNEKAAKIGDDPGKAATIAGAAGRGIAMGGNILGTVFSGGGDDGAVAAAPGHTSTDSGPHEISHVGELVSGQTQADAQLNAGPSMAVVHGKQPDGKPSPSTVPEQHGVGDAQASQADGGGEMLVAEQVG